MRASPKTPPAPDGSSRPRYRTGAVARMLQMPAATLRIWERRYDIAAPSTTPSGHRQYSAADVQRLALIRQLTSVGHPIGSLAALDYERLKEVASTHASALIGEREGKRRRQAAWKLAAVGPGAEHRLTRPGLQMRLERVVRVSAAFERLGDVGRRASATRHDALVVFVDGLQAPMLAQLQAAARKLHARSVAAVYSYAPSRVVHAFAGAGVALLRETAGDERLAGWLAALAPASREHGDATTPAARLRAPEMLPVAAALPATRRYDDATLADIAGLSSTIACECPRHVAEIIMKLSHFESYSGQCQHLDAADAALHGDLGQVAAAARAMFEAALERLAVHEGLVLARP